MAKSLLRERNPSPRLRNFDYVGSYAYFVTCVTEQRKPYFKDEAIVGKLLHVLEETSGQFGFGAYAYCFMPDHLHLLLTGEESSSLVKFMALFKQRTGFAFRKAHGLRLWQKSYYNHILRQEEALNDVAMYIFENPVRKGLVADYQDYPFYGSFVFDARELE